jgi:acyl-CoA hydrolase
MDFSDHQLTMTVLMTPDTANFAGNVHGGTILRLLDQVIFRQPVHVGELVTFLASVNHTGTSSMEIGVKVVAEDIQQRTVRHVNSCYFTMVALDDAGRPAAVPPLIPETHEEQRRHAAALLRRSMRRDMERQFAAARDPASRG